MALRLSHLYLFKDDLHWKPRRVKLPNMEVLRFDGGACYYDSVTSSRDSYGNCPPWLTINLVVPSNPMPAVLVNGDRPRDDISDLAFSHARDFSCGSQGSCRRRECD